MSKRAASKDSSGRLSKLLKSIDNNEKDDDFEDDEVDKGKLNKFQKIFWIKFLFILLETFIPQAASRRLDDSVDGEDDDLYRPSATGTTTDGARDFRSQMELKSDHGNRPLWVTPGQYSFK